MYIPHTKMKTFKISLPFCFKLSSSLFCKQGISEGRGLHSSLISDRFFMNNAQHQLRNNKSISKYSNSYTYCLRKIPHFN